MITLMRRADDVLRGRPVARSWHFIVVCGLLYGGVMGSFGTRAGQVAYSAVKVPLLLIATLALSLPSYFVLNTLLGVRSDFGAVIRALLASQAGLTIILVALAPLTAFWYASSAHYNAAILFNAAMFAVASLGAQVLLDRAYRPLIARNPRHRLLMRTWILIYAFVGVQMGWTLRPFVGAPNEPVQFFRGGEWENAYVIVARKVWDTITYGHSRLDPLPAPASLRE